jgi:DNA sulfur modification protein DndD
MKLRSARFRNFKLLRDLRVGFSLDAQRPLTVIRAENASGKTSTLNALRWGLYGLRGLEDPSIRLSPADWPDGQPCEVLVEIDFDHTLFNQIAGEFVPETDSYRLVRRVNETPAGDRFMREPDRISLYRLTDVGTAPVENPEAKIADMLPLEMKDIFFTDGDAAMTFISPQLTRATKKDQVEEAIKSLLGLGVLEAAADHVAKVQQRFTQRIGRQAGSGELTEISEKLAKRTEEREQVSAKKAEVVLQIEKLGRLYDEAEKALHLALQVGKHDELVERRTRAKRQLDTAKEIEERLKEDHRKLLEHESLSWALLDAPLRRAYEHLNSLHDRGVIPRTAVPVLEDRIEHGICICGTSLAEGTAERSRVEQLIIEQRSIDSDRQMLTRLFHTARSDFQERDAGTDDWARKLASLEKNRLETLKMREEAQQELRVCEDKLKEIDQADVQQKQAHRDAIRSSLGQAEDQRKELEIKERELHQEIVELTEKFNALRLADRQLRDLNARLTVTKDVASIIQGALEEIQTVYLRRVSDRMNELFLDMVGADPTEKGVFQKAIISDDYEIIVQTSDGRTLNPDHEVNGASQRALTFAFIWALTEVSGVIAPRVIDTPLGMMSGAVKRRVLEMISSPANLDVASGGEPDKQVVLFLTRSEIADTENILDERAGGVITFTNSDHYPVDLVHDPGVDAPQILTCACNHRQVCEVCERKIDADRGRYLHRPAA